MFRFFSVVVFLSGALSGCSFLADNGLSLDYSFDTLDFQQKFDPLPAPAPSTVPSIPCAGPQDLACQALADAIDNPNVTAFCDGTAHCAATIDVRLSYVINLSQQQNFPPQALEYGVRAVTLSEVAYWVRQNTLNVPTPALYIYVGPETAVDERDTRTQLLGTVSPLAAKSVACIDPIDPTPPSDAGAAMTCRLPIVESGRSALQSLAADYQTPFKVLVYAPVTVVAGDPIPSGTIAFSVKPTVALAVSTSL